MVEFALFQYLINQNENDTRGTHDFSPVGVTRVF